MIVTPHLGIGDLLIVKMKEISNKLNIEHINIHENLVREFCENYDLKINFITKFINLLFPNTTIAINNTPLNFSIMDQFKLSNVYIYDHINRIDINGTDIKNKSTNYIVFHTKMRYDGLIDNFITNSLPELNSFFTNFKTSKTILIMGEKNIGANIETRMHKTMSLYNDLLLLKKNNTVIDLTQDVLTCGNPDFNSYLNDLEIINKAVCNVTFGIGGPFCICKAFSKNNISFLPFYNLAPYKKTLDTMFSIDNSLVENVNELNNRLDKFIC
jgi:hypothetical protein